MEMKYVYCEVGIQVQNIIQMYVRFCIVQHLFNYIMTRGSSWKYRMLIHLVKKFITFSETDISGPPTNYSIVASSIQSKVLNVTTLYDVTWCAAVSYEFFLRHTPSTLCVHRSTVIYTITARSIYKTTIYELPNGSLWNRHFRKLLILHGWQSPLILLIPSKNFFNKKRG